MTTHLSDNKSQKALLQQTAILCVRGGTRDSGPSVGAPEIQSPWSPMESSFPGRFIVNQVPSLCWVLVTVTVVRWQSTGVKKCLSPEEDKETKVPISGHLFQHIMHSVFPGSTLVPRGL